MSFYKGLIRNPETENTPCLSFAQYLETEARKYTKFSTNVSNEMLLNAAKCQGYSLYHF